MLIIVCALECEARPIISTLGLKKTSILDAFQVFEGNENFLLVTGVGTLKTAVATTALISKLSDRKDLSAALFLNIGICGATKAFSIGEALLPHTIIHANHKKKFFQELLVKHPFKEVSLSTSDSPVTTVDSLQTDIVDMEAFGFFQAVTTFLLTTQASCVKVVSDNCQGVLLNKDAVSKMIADNFDNIKNYYSSLLQAIKKEPVLNDNEKLLLKNLSSSLNFTAYQEIELEKMAVSFKVRSKGELEFLTSFLSIAPQNKAEAKAAFLSIQGRLNA